MLPGTFHPFQIRIEACFVFWREQGHGMFWHEASSQADWTMVKMFLSRGLRPPFKDLRLERIHRFCSWWGSSSVDLL